MNELQENALDTEKYYVYSHAIESHIIVGWKLAIVAIQKRCMIIPTDKLTEIKATTANVTTYNITLNYLPPTGAL